MSISINTYSGGKAHLTKVTVHYYLVVTVTTMWLVAQV